MKWPKRFAQISPNILDLPWKEIDYCSIDLETTGLNLKRDEIISIGLTQIHQGRISSKSNFYQVIKPTGHPSISSVLIHGLRSVDLESAKPLQEVIPNLVLELTGRTLIAHAAWVERAFLAEKFKGTGFTYPNQVLDTASLARACGIKALESGKEPSLEFIARHLGLPVYSPHHALGDALTTAVVFLALASDLERKHRTNREAGLTLQDLFDISRHHAS